MIKIETVVYFPKKASVIFGAIKAGGLPLHEAGIMGNRIIVAGDWTEQQIAEVKIIIQDNDTRFSIMADYKTPSDIVIIKKIAPK